MVRAEFTVFPFRQGQTLPEHVRAAVEAAESAGVRVEVGPLSTVVEGEAEAVLEAVRAAQAAAFAAGATRVTTSVETAR